MPAAPARPTSVTLVCLFVGFSAGLLLVNLTSLLGDWGSLAMQDSLRDTLEAEPFSSAGVTIDQALSWLRIAAQVIVVLCIATAVLAVYTARGHEASRWALTVLLGLTALVFASTLLAGLFPALFAVVAIFVLWSKDSRRWFAEKNGRPVPAVAATAPDATAREAAGADPFSSIAPPAPGSTGQDAGHPPATPQHAAVPQHPVQQHPQQAMGRTPGRPRPVEIAFWTTAAVSGLVLAASLSLLLLVTAGGDLLRQQLDSPGLSRDLLDGSGWSVDLVITVMTVVAAISSVLALVGLAAAALARAGRESGRRALQVMSIVTIVVSAVATLGFVPMNLLTLGAAVVVLVMLAKPETKAWFAARSDR